MQKQLFLLLIAGLFSQPVTAQKYKTRSVVFSYYQYPQVGLDSTYKTYSVSGTVADYAGGNYVLSSQRYALPLQRKSGEDGDIALLINIGYYTPDNRAIPAIVSGSQTEKINGKDSSVTVYSYRGGFYQPYDYTLRDNVSNSDLFTASDRIPVTISTGWYKSSEEAIRNWDNALRSQMAAQGQALVRNLATTLNRQMEQQFYTGMQRTRVDVYYIKDRERYSDLDSAAQMAAAAYSLIKETLRGRHDSFAVAIAAAEAIWLRALQQQSPDKDARINAKVVNILLQNLGYAALWQNQWDKALAYASQADANDKREGWIYLFQRLVADQRKRLGNAPAAVLSPVPASAHQPTGNPQQ
jgi:hypothetical protein